MSDSADRMRLRLQRRTAKKFIERRRKTQSRQGAFGRWTDEIAKGAVGLDGDHLMGSMLEIDQAVAHAVSLQKHEHWDQALAAFNRALSGARGAFMMHPNFVYDMYFSRAICQANLEQFTDAIESAALALHYAPHRPPALMLQAVCRLACHADTQTETEEHASLLGVELRLLELLAQAHHDSPIITQQILVIRAVTAHLESNFGRCTNLATQCIDQLDRGRPIPEFKRSSSSKETRVPHATMAHTNTGEAAMKLVEPCIDDNRAADSLLVLALRARGDSLKFARGMALGEAASAEYEGLALDAWRRIQSLIGSDEAAGGGHSSHTSGSALGNIGVGFERASDHERSEGHERDGSSCKCPCCAWLQSRRVLSMAGFSTLVNGLSLLWLSPQPLYLYALSDALLASVGDANLGAAVEQGNSLRRQRLLACTELVRSICAASANAQGAQTIGGCCCECCKRTWRSEIEEDLLRELRAQISTMEVACKTQELDQQRLEAKIASEGSYISQALGNAGFRDSNVEPIPDLGLSAREFGDLDDAYFDSQGSLLLDIRQQKKTMSGGADSQATLRCWKACNTLCSFSGPTSEGATVWSNSTAAQSVSSAPTARALIGTPQAQSQNRNATRSRGYTKIGSVRTKMKGPLIRIATGKSTTHTKCSDSADVSEGNASAAGFKLRIRVDGHVLCFHGHPGRDAVSEAHSFIDSFGSELHDFIDSADEFTSPSCVEPFSETRRAQCIPLLTALLHLRTYASKVEIEQKVHVGGHVSASTAAAVGGNRKLWHARMEREAQPPKRQLVPKHEHVCPHGRYPRTCGQVFLSNIVFFCCLIFFCSAETGRSC
jgi:hypothetical protein